MDWEIVRAKDLKVGDLVRPINAAGPIMRVSRVGRDAFELEDRVVAWSDESLRMEVRHPDLAQLRRGWVPRAVGTVGEDAPVATTPGPTGAE